MGKGVHQGCILSPCLFNLYAEYIVRNTGLEETQAGIRIAGRNINNLRYADDTTLMAGSEELKSLLMKVKEESKKVALKHNIQKTKIMASGPITSWEIDGETVETVSDFILGKLQNHPTPVLLPGKSHGRRSLVGCSPWRREESDMTARLSLFTFMHWRRKWQPTPVFLPGESQGRGSLVVCRLWGHTESDMTEAT